MSNQITPLPDVPSPTDPVDIFDAKAFAFNAALGVFGDEANAVALDMQNNADVAAALLLGMALPQYAGTSTTSLAIGTGAKSFVTQSGKAWTVGQEVVASNGSSYMKGNVTGYTGTALDVNVTRTSGSGTLASWTIGLSYKALGLAPRATRIDVASDTTLDLTTLAPDTDDIRITAANPISTVNLAVGRVVRCVMAGAASFVNSASIVTQTGANLVCAAGDTLTLRATAPNVVEVLNFTSANGLRTATSVPTSGSYTAGDLILERSTNGEVSGWRRLTTGSGHVLGTDWLYFGSLGVGQTHQDVTSSRAVNTTYYNTTPKPIFIVIIGLGGGSGVDILCNGVKVGFLNTSSYASSASFACPPGGSYIWNSAGGTKTLWTEFR